MPRFPDSSGAEDEDDILAEYENRSDEGQANLSDEERNENDEDDEDKKDGVSTGRRIDPATSRKHIIRNPIPKLDVERLRGPKGIHTIEKYFEGFKFHGKGHEKTDLDRVMKRLEHWAHRLFPKLEYDDFLTKVEGLAKKKELQVYIKKYRLDMLPSDDVLSADVVDDKEEEQETEPLDEFDVLIAEQIEKQKQATMERASQPSNSASQSNDNMFDQLIANTASSSVNLEPRKENPPSQMTDEVRERIERNRQQALQRKLARQRAREEEAKQKNLEGISQSQPIVGSQSLTDSQTQN